MSARTSAYTLVLGLGAVNLLGCLPIPLLPGDTSGTRLNIDSVVPEFIVVGRTTRGDVLLDLGEPDGASERGEQFTYTRVTSKGGVFGLLVGSYPGVAGATAKRMVYHRLFVTFDDEGVVVSARMESASCWEKSMGPSSPACVDVHGYDVMRSGTLQKEEASKP